MDKPKSVDDFIAEFGPYDPPLTENERAHVQNWIDHDEANLWLRPKFENCTLNGVAIPDGIWIR